MRYHFTPTRMAIMKNNMSVNLQKNWNSCTLLTELKNGSAFVENSFTLTQKLKQNIHIISIHRNSTLRDTPKIIENMYSNKYMYIHVIASLLTTAKRQKQPNGTSIDKQIMVLHIMGYYSAIKRDKDLIHSTMWKNLRNVMLSERSQISKVIHYMISFL